ncbi:beta-ketoacyl synthase chain length factor [Cupriavidus basilensis]|uniref:Beta-ketoacyl synthase chain length factor n=1 Tax=Cupriavidus basilensis TaxID=68895 RepID=A0ABT6AT09_9BURK|nr:beta-ketoacyl synthase chain length factor [Cupriavidus basilensis]MDF3835599.1 beta-ketoacyl synthase chain length factor [Cupriavidus basilensis]
MQLSAFIEGIGLLGPGFQDWQHGAAVLAGTLPYANQPTELPPPAGLPPAERRRTGPCVKLALAVGQQAVAASGMDAAALPTVFSASSGDGYNYHAICEALASQDPLISPTRFHNSVHNAAAGYWGIASGAMTSSNVLCARDGSFGAGLLDSLCQVAVDGEACLLIAYDTDYPEPLRSHRPIPDAFGLALVLLPQPGARSIARLDVTLAEAPASRMPLPELEQLRQAVPAARALPMLQALALGGPREVVIDYLDDLRLRVAITPLEAA